MEHDQFDYFNKPSDLRMEYFFSVLAVIPNSERTHVYLEHYSVRFKCNNSASVNDCKNLTTRVI